PLRVRIALHTAEVEPEEGDYHDLELNYASRMANGGHGGQILCSEETARLLSAEWGVQLQLIDLGLYRLWDVAAPWRLFQVSCPQMPQSEFPALRLQRYLFSYLPPRYNEFVGRETEIEQLCELLRAGAEQGRTAAYRSRLVTLTGPGGIGKTRLAQEVA